MRMSANAVSEDPKLSSLAFIQTRDLGAPENLAMVLYVLIYYARGN